MRIKLANAFGVSTLSIFLLLNSTTMSKSAESPGRAASSGTSGKAGAQGKPGAMVKSGAMVKPGQLGKPPLATPGQLGQSTQLGQQGHYTYKGRVVSAEYAEAIKLSQQAHSLDMNKNYAGAEVMLRKALNVAGDDAEGNCNLAFALLNQNRAEEALSYYEKAASLDPQSEAVYGGWSAAYGALGRLQDSLRINNQLLAKFPNSKMYSKYKNQADNIKEEIDRLARNNSMVSANGAETSIKSDNYLNDSNGLHTNSWRRYGKPISVCLQSGAKLRNWKPGYIAIMEEAFSKWTDSSDGLVRFSFVDDPTEAQIVCGWTDDLNQTSLKKGGELGETRTLVTIKGDLVKANITMLTLSPFDSSPLSEDLIRLTALHEVGHSLGICGHSSNASDIMYFAALAAHSPELSSRDGATLQALYTRPSNEIRSASLTGLGERNNSASWHLSSAGNLTGAGNTESSGASAWKVKGTLINSSEQAPAPVKTSNSTITIEGGTNSAMSVTASSGMAETAPIIERGGAMVRSVTSSSKTPQPESKFYKVGDAVANAPMANAPMAGAHNSSNKDESLLAKPRIDEAP